MKLTTIGVVLLGACSGIGGRCGGEEARATLAMRVQEASLAADALAAESPTSSGEQILERMKQDPEVGRMLARIDGAYPLQVRAQGGHAVVLLCCEDGSRALIEDSACTPGIDRDESRRPRSACAFTIDPAAACAAR